MEQLLFRTRSRSSAAFQIEAVQHLIIEHPPHVAEVISSHSPMCPTLSLYIRPPHMTAALPPRAWSQWLRHFPIFHLRLRASPRYPFPACALHCLCSSPRLQSPCAFHTTTRYHHTCAPFPIRSPVERLHNHRPYHFAGVLSA